MRKHVSIQKVMYLLIGLCIVLGCVTPVYATDTVSAVIDVKAESPCMVRLKGVSDNTSTYVEEKELKDQTSFSITYNEPGEYEYELQQVKNNESEIYDSHVYKVFVSVIYDEGTMKAVVTGGTKGSDEKQEEFVFVKQKEPEEPKPEDPTTPTKPSNPSNPTTPSQRTDVIKTGDETRLGLWIGTLVLSGFMLVILMFIERKHGKDD